MSAAHSIPAPTRANINRALRPLGIEIQHGRGAGYSYFTSLRHGHQIGESVYYAYLHSASVASWLVEARIALAHHRKNGTPFAYVTQTKKRP